MKQILSNFLCVMSFCTFSFFVHPMHISVCEIEYDEHNKSLEISQQMFIDDLEGAIKKSLGIKNLDLMEPGEGYDTGSLLHDYLRDHLMFKVNGRGREYVFLGYESEGNVLRCYVEIEGIKRLKSLEVASSILSDEFGDQANLVHLEYQGKTNSLKLTPARRVDAFQIGG